MMRKKTEGVALAAIVAKETSEGSWSGTGGGVGIGTGGLGLFTGSMSGTKQEQTQRAKEFQPPRRSQFNWWYVLSPAVFLAGVALMPGFSGTILGVIAAGDTSGSPLPNGTLGEAVDNVTRMVIPVFGTVAATGAALCLLFGSSKRTAEEEVRLETARIIEDAHEAIFHRLRYFEADHIVFDPMTGKEVPANTAAIQTLIASIASEPQAQPDADSS